MCGWFDIRPVSFEYTAASVLIEWGPFVSLTFSSMGIGDKQYKPETKDMKPWQQQLGQSDQCVSQNVINEEIMNLQ